MYRYTSRRDPGTDPFVRDAPTLLCYAVLGCWTFWLYAVGPAVTLLRDELGFSYTVLGLHQVLLSLGVVLAGAGFARSAQRLSRGVLLWSSALVTAVGAALFVLGTAVPATLLAAGVLGLGGTVLLTVVQAVLSDRHGDRRDRALTEANVVAGASAVLAPLVLGGLAVTALGWRAAFVLPAAVLLVLHLRHRREPLPVPARSGATEGTGRLPLACVLFAVLTALAGAVEFCLVTFGPQVLVAAGLSSTAAGTALLGNYLGILVGRLGGARLTRRPGRAVPLLHASWAVTGAGVVLFWLADQPVLALLGLFLSGLGIANLYPLALALALGASGGREDRVNARSQLLIGLVGAAAPLLLGGLADRFGVAPAFAVVPVLVVLGVLLLHAGLRARRAAV